MTGRQIKILLLKKGLRQTDLARELFVSRSMISSLIAGRYKSRRLQVAIANRLGLPYAELWPQEGNKAA